MVKILVVEDTLTTQTLIESALEDLGAVTCTASIGEADQALRESKFDLVVLDVQLPDGDGFALCEKLRARPEYKETPIIFLTSQSQVDNRVRGLRLGGDDYVVKPFDPNELCARAEARLRRPSAGSSGKLEVAGFRADMDGQAVYFTPPGQPERNLELTRIEFKLLVLFLRHPGQVFARLELLKKIWGENTHVSEHTVDTHISSLRKKIAASAAQLKSIPKQGYILELPRP